LPAGKARLAPVSRQGFAPQILAEQFIHFIRELLYYKQSMDPPGDFFFGLFTKFRFSFKNFFFACIRRNRAPMRGFFAAVFPWRKYAQTFHPHP
jgi:hypothetical protein